MSLPSCSKSPNNSSQWLQFSMICAWTVVLAPARSKFKQQKHTKSSTFVGCWSLRFICFFHKFDDKLINDRLNNLFNNNVSSSVGNVSRQYFIMFCMFAAFNFYHSFIECFFSCIFFCFEPQTIYETDVDFWVYLLVLLLVFCVMLYFISPRNLITCVRVCSPYLSMPPNEWDFLLKFFFDSSVVNSIWTILSEKCTHWYYNAIDLLRFKSSHGHWLCVPCTYWFMHWSIDFNLFFAVDFDWMVNGEREHAMPEHK